MRPEEITAIGELAGEAAAGTTRQLQDLHGAVAGHVWRAVGPVALPFSRVHDQLARAAYSASRGASRTAIRAGLRAVSAVRSSNAPSLQERPAGRAAVAVLNAAIGDSLAERRSPLAVRMSLRHLASDVYPSAERLAEAFPDATGRLAVFVHGLGHTEEAWKHGSGRQASYGACLHEELGYTPLYVRYNSGRHIFQNGRDLSTLLHRITAAWPTEVDELMLIGHEMGALVARSACHHGGGSDWCAKVSRVFLLGGPHLGAPLERAANATSTALALVPETRGLACAIETRSAGIKDLRHACEIPYLATAEHHFISGSVSRRANGLLGRLLGDLVVGRANAWSQRPRERLPFPADHYVQVGGCTHSQLLGHPAVYEQLRRALCERSALPAPVLALGQEMGEARSALGTMTASHRP